MIDKHVVLIDASMGMEGEPLERSAAHARAYHPDAPAYAFLDDRIVWSGKGAEIRYETLQPLLGGPSGLQMALAEARVAHGKSEDGVHVVIYTDGDMPLVQELSNPFSSGTLRITRGEDVDRIRKEVAGTGFHALPIPDAGIMGTMPLARINSMIGHILAQSSETIDSFQRQVKQNPAAALESCDGAFRAAARAE